MSDKESQISASDYKSSLKPIWCPGCGDYAVLNAIRRAFADLEIPRHETAVISGIGCSSRLPGYLTTYGFNTLHGRAIPIATGTKLARPETTVIAVGGDGDMFSIGGGHLPHAARRNVDITVIVMDNRIYGLTKGQMSPTTPLDSYTSTTQYGSYDPPIDMVRSMFAYNTGFIARGFSANIKQLESLMKQGIQHRGFAFIQVLSPCVTYMGKEEYDTIRAIARDIPDDYDPTDPDAAYEIARDTEHLHMGLIYKNPELQPYRDRILNLQDSVLQTDIDTLIDEFRP